MLFEKCRLSFTAIHTLNDINFLFESQTIRDHIGRRKKEVKLERFLIPHDLYVTFSYSISTNSRGEDNRLINDVN